MPESIFQCYCRQGEASNLFDLPTRPHLQEVCKDASSQVLSLRQMLKEKDEAIQRQSNLEKKIHELEKQGTIKIHKKGDGDISILPSCPAGAVLPPGATVVVAGNGSTVGPNHVGVGGGGVPGQPPPPAPPPPPVNGSCRFRVNTVTVQLRSRL